MVPVIVTVLIAVGALVIGGVAGFIVRRAIAEKSIGSAEEQAKKILEELEPKTSETKKPANGKKSYPRYIAKRFRDSERIFHKTGYPVCHCIFCGASEENTEKTKSERKIFLFSSIR